TVAKVEGDDITIDGNHPLAGVKLTFAVNIVDVRDATAEEISHGHVHADGNAEH
ncbi:MAG: peptidylprolyl isomerase, partial [Granulosicoccaceae bacterium]